MASNLADDTFKKLSTSADFLLTGLAVAAPKTLARDEICDNVGVCAGQFEPAIGELISRGFARRSPVSSYELTDAGSRYVEYYYVLVRDGEFTTLKPRRDGSR